MKILTIIGARPQFIKASVVSAEFAKNSNIKEIVVHTGQHFDANMSDVFFSELGMAKPDYNLAIHGGNHGAMTGRMLEAIENVLLKEKPDALLIYGDTNSTLAGALAAAKLHIPVAHVEAGLRSFNMRMPEEVNRILADRVSTWLFAPTEQAVQHLRQEGVAADKIHNVGDVMYDVALHHGKRADAREDNALSRFGLTSGNYVLATCHRAENTDHPARVTAIINALIDVAHTLPVVLPLHPRTKGALQKLNLLDALAAAVTLTEPLGYLDMVQLECHAAVIATDSGGVQKEAFFHKVPCVTLRDETEWTELVDAGWNKLVPPLNAADIASAVIESQGVKGKDIKPYGAGDAAKRIYEVLL